MELDEAVRMGRALLDEHGLDDWRLVLDRAKVRAGVCRPQRKEIGLSRALTALHPEAEVRDTLLHEIAHALVGAGHGHDAVWRAKAREIGCTARRCVDPDAPKVAGDWVGTCPAGHTVTRHRRPERPAACSRCAPTFDVANLFRWTHRGRPAEMTPAYQAQLRRLTEPAEPLRLRVGDRLRVVARGKYHGVVGTLVKAGRTRFHLQVDGGVLTVPFSLVEPVEPG